MTRYLIQNKEDGLYLKSFFNGFVWTLDKHEAANYRVESTAKYLVKSVPNLTQLVNIVKVEL